MLVNIGPILRALLGGRLPHEGVPASTGRRMAVWFGGVLLVKASSSRAPPVTALCIQ
jgi:hypothetical protein